MPLARIPVVALLRGWFVMRDCQTVKGTKYKDSAHVLWASIAEGTNEPVG